MQNILIISESQSYLSMSIKEKLKEAAYEVLTAEPDIDVICEIKEAINIILIYADEELVKKQQVLNYIRDNAAEADTPIFVIGSMEEVHAVETIISKHLIEEEFIRPINVNEVTEKIDNYIKFSEKRQKKKILVVDDSGAMLRNVKGWLEDRYQVVLANSGAMAIKYLALNRPDLVLLDYEMPVVDGKQVLEMIRTETDFADIPVIFLTSKDDRKSVMDVMALKPEGYLLKSMEPGQIVKAVDDFFEKRRRNQILSNMTDR